MKNSTLSRVLFLCSFLVVLSTARAQYVAIPDSLFGNWLHHNVDSNCITGNGTIGYRMDTTCTAVANTTTIVIEVSNLRDLTGVTYFRNLRTLRTSSIFGFNTDSLAYLPALPASLKYLQVGYCILTSLPALPPTLDTLICGNDKRLVSMPPLPSTLMYLDCDNNSLPSLPALPASLIYLDCSHNQNHLTSLPVLPPALTYLDCSSNYLIPSLPALPATLKTLNCSSLQHLISLPVLPSSLTKLTCEDDSLTSLPALPASLTTLLCDDNPLRLLPVIPAALTTLSCSHDSLTSLLALPATLTSLNYSYNPLSSQPPLPIKLNSLTCGGVPFTSLPALPDSLWYLNCSYAPITSLPHLPPTLSGLECTHDSSLYCLPAIAQPLLQFYILGSPITCVPNHIIVSLFGSYDRNPNSIALCTPSSGCDFYYNISGNLHYDTAATCISDSLHPGYSLTSTKVVLKKGGQVIQQTYPSLRGEYSFKTDSLTGYSVDVDTVGSPFTTLCPVAGSRSVSLSPADTVEIAQSFGLRCTSVDTFPVDYGVRKDFFLFEFFKPGKNTTMHLYAGDLTLAGKNPYCNYEAATSDTSGTVTVTYSGPIQYVGPAPWALVPASVSGSTITYNIANLKNLGHPYYWYHGALDILVKTDTTATLGDQVCFFTTVVASVPDGNPLNDTLTQCYEVGVSWDPNHKDVMPADTFRSGEWLEYMVHFQNKGNAPAELVVVKDTLSNYVDATTFQYLASSHHVVTQVAGSAVTFTFPEINLVDSATDNLASQGWVQYKVKAKANLPLMTQVSNTAYIYFDYNPAVVTNTTVNTVDTVAAPLSVAHITDGSAMHLYPNPNNGTFTLQTSNSLHGDYTITDMLGDVIEQKTIMSDRQSIDLTSASAGVYTLSVKGAQPIRFVVMK